MVYNRILYVTTVTYAGHSHSIVSSTCKRLKTDDLMSGHTDFTVRSTGKKYCLGAIDAERVKVLWQLSDDKGVREVR